MKYLILNETKGKLNKDSILLFWSAVNSRGYNLTQFVYSEPVFLTLNINFHYRYYPFFTENSLNWCFRYSLKLNRPIFRPWFWAFRLLNTSFEPFIFVFQDFQPVKSSLDRLFEPLWIEWGFWSRLFLYFQDIFIKVYYARLICGSFSR